MMAQKAIKELWGIWMERTTRTTGQVQAEANSFDTLREQVTEVFGKDVLRKAGLEGADPDTILDDIIERLELALTDVKTVRDNLKVSK